MSYQTYDFWKCTDTTPVHPDAVGLHDECEATIERLESEVESLTAEIGLRDQVIERLEVELAACREGRS